jgi:hypothetical protein
MPFGIGAAVAGCRRFDAAWCPLTSCSSPPAEREEKRRFELAELIVV